MYDYNFALDLDGQNLSALQRKKKKLNELLDKYGESRESIDQHSSPEDWMEYQFAQGDQYINEILEERRLKRAQNTFPQTPFPSMAQENPNYTTPTNLPETKESEDNSKNLTANSPLMIAKKLNKYKESSKFNKLINSVFEEEGGYEDNSKKIDQPTNMGIIQSTLDNFNKLHPNFKINKNLKTLTKEDAQLIYKLDYYDQYHLEDIKNNDNSKILLHMFIMLKPNTALTLLHQSLNKFGYPSQKLLVKEMIPTLNKIEKDNKSEDFKEILKSNFLQYLKNNPDAHKYKGWFSRIERL